jgi:hypothetical protein
MPILFLKNSRDTWKIPDGYHQEGRAKKTKQTKPKQNISKDENTHIHKHALLCFSKCPPFAKEKIQPCPPTTL